MTAITRDEAIDRMRDGLPCETDFTIHGNWKATTWGDFDNPCAKFRIPPEPRREAREFWCEEGNRAGELYIWKDRINAEFHCNSTGRQVIHVREVLSDEVCLRKMTLTECYEQARLAHATAGPFVCVKDIVAQFARAIGLLKEDKS